MLCRSKKYEFQNNSQELLNNNVRNKYQGQGYDDNIVLTKIILHCIAMDLPIIDMQLGLMDTVLRVMMFLSFTKPSPIVAIWIRPSYISN